MGDYANLSVVLDFENEMLHHTLSHIHLPINQQTERDKVRVPVVELSPKFSGAIEQLKQG